MEQYLCNTAIVNFLLLKSPCDKDRTNKYDQTGEKQSVNRQMLKFGPVLPFQDEVKSIAR